MTFVPADLPDDFDAFWAEAWQEAKSAALDYRRTPAEGVSCPFDHRVDLVEFRGVHGETLHGWFAYPEGARRIESFAWIPPYGRESVLPNRYGTRDGFCSISLNFHGHEAFHQEKYDRARGYFSEGAEDPANWIFRTMFQNACLAVRVLQAQTEVDEDRIGAMGLSQGGGISIWLGAFCPIVKAVCADFPFLASIRQTLGNQIYRYPLKELSDYMDSIPLGRERVFNTLTYYDTTHVATRCQVPTQVSYGKRDPAVRPESVEAVYNALPGLKNLLIYEGGHDWDPAMVEANRHWLVESLS